MVSLLGACEPQVTPEYRGEPLALVSGSVQNTTGEACSETLTTGNYRVSVLANRNGSELATADGYGLFEVRSDGGVTWLRTEAC